MYVFGFGDDCHCHQPCRQLLPTVKLMGADIGNRPLLTMAVVLGLAGIQLFCFSLLAELLIRTYHESRETILHPRHVAGGRYESLGL